MDPKACAVVGVIRRIQNKFLKPAKAEAHSWLLVPTLWGHRPPREPAECPSGQELCLAGHLQHHPDFLMFSSQSRPTSLGSRERAAPQTQGVPAYTWVEGKCSPVIWKALPIVSDQAPLWAEKVFERKQAACPGRFLRSSACGNLAQTQEPT